MGVVVIPAASLLPPPLETGLLVVVAVVVWVVMVVFVVVLLPLVRGVVRIVRVRSKSAFRAMIVVISDTVMRETSSPSIATIRSPGLTFSAKTDDVRTPETTVPLLSALLAKMIPNLPGGATTVIRLRRAVAPVVVVVAVDAAAAVLLAVRRW